MRYTYSHWNGSQEYGVVEADALMAAIAPVILANGDVDSALKTVVRDGIQTQTARLPGVRELLRALRDQRLAELQRYDFDSVLTDSRDRLGAVIAAERGAVAGTRDHKQAGPNQARTARHSVAERRSPHSNAQSVDSPEAATQMADHDRVDDGARAQPSADMLVPQRDAMERHFQGLEQTPGEPTGTELSDFKDMVRALDTELGRRRSGLPVECGALMERFSQYVYAVDSLDALLNTILEQSAGAESRLNSNDLESTLQSMFQDRELDNFLSRIAEHVDNAASLGAPQAERFADKQSITLLEALLLLQRMSDLDRLERELERAHESGDVSAIDPQGVQSILGAAFGSAVEQLRGVRSRLTDAGYLVDDSGVLDITSTGVRVLGSRALSDIFSRMRPSSLGDHATARNGLGGDRADDTKAFEFGDAFNLDLKSTVMNAVIRDGATQPLRIRYQDFEVYRTEQWSRSATVLMLDMSRSMPLRGCYVAARKVALALSTLIRTRFPQDVLYVVGFSDRAHELRPELLHRASWSENVHGTNMQHGFMLARHFLGRHRHGTRQIILITDGEPTAYLDGGEVRCSYPPSPATFEETLKEVRRCTDEGIIINSFMLDRTHYLTDFVTRMTRINHGRAFFAAPERLGDYILVDYVRTKERTRVR